MKKYTYFIALAIMLSGAFPAINLRASDGSTIENVVPDTTITAAVKAKYMADERIKSLDINVTTVNGIVTLRGKVDSMDVIDRAVSLAKNTNGVKEVVSNITTK